MPGDFFDELFGDGEDEDREPYDAGDLQRAWDSAIHYSRYWEDFTPETQDVMFDRFMDAFSRGGTRFGMEEWFEDMGVDDLFFDWQAWREANGYD